MKSKAGAQCGSAPRDPPENGQAGRDKQQRCCAQRRKFPYSGQNLFVRRTARRDSAFAFPSEGKVAGSSACGTTGHIPLKGKAIIIVSSFPSFFSRKRRGLGRRPISAISVHIMSGRGARRESPSLFLRPAHRGSEGECTEVGAGQLFRSKCFRQSACGFMKDLWAGWLRGESLYPDEKRVNVRK